MTMVVLCLGGCYLSFPWKVQINQSVPIYCCYIPKYACSQTQVMASVAALDIPSSDRTRDEEISL